jgi:hypothetical protein
MSHNVVQRSTQVTDLPAPTRAYTLTGLTNYVPYTITLNAVRGSTPILTGTVAIMPTDLQVFMPVIGRE